MSFHPRAAGRVLLVTSLFALSAACRSADAQKQRHFERGNRYAAEKRDDFAVIEYASAVRLDPKFGEARLKLAETYERMNNLRAALPEYIRAADALPDNRAAQIKATQIFLLGRRFDDAKARSASLLKKDPKDLEALLLHANATAALNDPDGAIAEVEEALKLQPDDSHTFVNLGAVRMQSGDAAEAEAAFNKAINLDPSSVNAHLALANFLWSANRQLEAEQEIQSALALEPRHLLANRMLGTLYISMQRQDEAEQPLKVVAETSKLPAARFALVEYYLRVRRADDATKLLTQLAADQETSAVAEMMLASIDYDAGRRKEGHARLDQLLLKVPRNSPALVMKARWLTNENKLDEAADRAKAAVAADPESATAYFALGMVHDLRHEISDSIKAYNEVLRLNPRAVGAQIQLSRLNLAVGDRDTALRHAEEAKQTEPTNVPARIAIARTLLLQGNVERAQREIVDLQRAIPNSADVHTLSGMLELRRNNKPAAKASFKRALEMAPRQFEAIAGLVEIDLQAKQFASAVTRVESELQKQPDRPNLLTLAAQVYDLAGQNDKAEQALRRAVTVDSHLSDAYGMLAQLYVKQKRLDDARAEFEGMVKRDPKAVGPRTMVGVIFEAQGKRDEAKRWYETTIKVVTNAPVIANNLAAIYAEEGTNLDVALQLATGAKQQMPDSPVIDDTLGWVYYKKNLPALAVRPLEDSLKKIPNHPEILYHLGVTYAKIGEKAKARAALEQALKLNPQMTGAADARQTLAAVSQ